MRAQAGLVVVLALVAGSGLVTGAAPAALVTIDLNAVRQVMEGFGTSSVYGRIPTYRVLRGQ